MRGGAEGRRPDEDELIAALALSLMRSVTPARQTSHGRAQTADCELGTGAPPDLCAGTSRPTRSPSHTRRVRTCVPPADATLLSGTQEPHSRAQTTRLEAGGVAHLLPLFSLAAPRPPTASSRAVHSCLPHKLGPVTLLPASTAGRVFAMQKRSSLAPSLRSGESLRLHQGPALLDTMYRDRNSRLLPVPL